MTRLARGLRIALPEPVNPKLRNGTDLATAVLSGTCTVKQGNVVVSDSPTQEMRTMTYVRDSCTGGPAPNFACANNTAFTAIKMLAVTTTTLPAATLDTPYSASLAAIGGTSPYTFSLKSGSLPTGLSLSPSGAISGTPVVPGTASFTAAVIDSANPAGVATQALSITAGGCTASVTGNHGGSIYAEAGTTCITGANIGGPVVIAPGAVVAVSHSRIGGPLVSNGAHLLSVCASQIGGQVTVTGSTGFVLIGDGDDDGSPACGPNSIAGSVSLTPNTSGVELAGNAISGRVSLSPRSTGNGPDAENADVEANRVARP